MSRHFNPNDLMYVREDKRWPKHLHYTEATALDLYLALINAYETVNKDEIEFLLLEAVHHIKEYVVDETLFDHVITLLKTTFTQNFHGALFENDSIAMSNNLVLEFWALVIISFFPDAVANKEVLRTILGQDIVDRLLDNAGLMLALLKKKIVHFPSKMSVFDTISDNDLEQFVKRLNASDFLDLVEILYEHDLIESDLPFIVESLNGMPENISSHDCDVFIDALIAIYKCNWNDLYEIQEDYPAINFDPIKPVISEQYHREQKIKNDAIRAWILEVEPLFPEDKKAIEECFSEEINAETPSSIQPPAHEIKAKPENIQSHSASLSTAGVFTNKSRSLQSSAINSAETPLSPAASSPFSPKIFFDSRPSSTLKQKIVDNSIRSTFV